ncbi:hypothetical protein N9N67_10450 [Bacteriovoracaceae bacterium]|nr:hypothetical protein [Bacteriovoracaceae bacterium]
MDNLKPMYEVDFQKVDHSRTIEYYIFARLERLEDLLPNKSYIKLKFKFMGIRRISGAMEIRTKDRLFSAHAISRDVIDCFDDLEAIIMDQIDTWKRNRIFSYAI